MAGLGYCACCAGEAPLLEECWVQSSVAFKGYVSRYCLDEYPAGSVEFSEISSIWPFPDTSIFLTSLVSISSSGEGTSVVFFYIGSNLFDDPPFACATRYLSLSITENWECTKGFSGTCQTTATNTVNKWDGTILSATSQTTTGDWAWDFLSWATFNPFQVESSSLTLTGLTLSGKLMNGPNEASSSLVFTCTVTISLSNPYAITEALAYSVSHLDEVTLDEMIAYYDPLGTYQAATVVFDSSGAIQVTYEPPPATTFLGNNKAGHDVMNGSAIQGKKAAIIVEDFESGTLYRDENWDCGTGSTSSTSVEFADKWYKLEDIDIGTAELFAGSQAP